MFNFEQDYSYIWMLYNEELGPVTYDSDWDEEVQQWEEDNFKENNLYAARHPAASPEIYNANALCYKFDLLFDFDNEFDFSNIYCYLLAEEDEEDEQHPPLQDEQDEQEDEILEEVDILEVFYDAMMLQLPHPHLESFMFTNEHSETFVKMDYCIEGNHDVKTKCRSKLQFVYQQLFKQGRFDAIYNVKYDSDPKLLEFIINTL
jgi:hypothetical protein